MSQPALPVIRLKPKSGVARALRHGAPWVFADEVVLDRRTRALPPGSVARLQDGDRAPLAVVAVNPASRIAVRVLDRDPDAVIDRGWLRDRLMRAHALRAALYPAPYHRLVHAEGDGLPGLVIDRFGDWAVIQPNAAWAERLLPDLVPALAEVTGVRHVLKNAAGRARAAEGLDDAGGVLIGQAPDAPVPVGMNGAIYMADLVGGQKTGLFYDQRDNHAFAARLLRGRPGVRVLDVFSHVGGFALAALAAGAGQALAVDGSGPALALAREGAARMGVADRFETRRADAFDALAALAAEGARFDMVVCDPPAFAPNKAALDKGLRAYERLARLAAGLVAGGGILGLCSCSHAAGPERFRTACSRGIGRAGRGDAAQLLHTGFAGPDHPQHPQLPETGYLKALFYRL